MRKTVMAMALVLPAFCHAEISGKAAVERDIAAMEARNAAVEKSFPAAVSVLDYAGNPVLKPETPLEINRGDFYSFWVSPSVRGESRGYLGGGGPSYGSVRDM